MQDAVTDINATPVGLMTFKRTTSEQFPSECLVYSGHACVCGEIMQGQLVRHTFISG